MYYIYNIFNLYAGTRIYDTEVKKRPLDLRWFITTIIEENY